MVRDMAIRIAIAIGVAWQGGGYRGGRENNFRDRYRLERTAASLQRHCWSVSQIWRSTR